MRGVQAHRALRSLGGQHVTKRTAIVVELTDRQLRLLKTLDTVFGETVPEKVAHIVRDWLGANHPESGVAR